MTQILTPQIRAALKKAAGLEPHIKERGMSAVRNEAIESVVAAARRTHPDMFYTDVFVKNQGWVGKQ